MSLMCVSGVRGCAEACLFEPTQYVVSSFGATCSNVAMQYETEVCPFSASLSTFFLWQYVALGKGIINSGRDNH